MAVFTAPDWLVIAMVATCLLGWLVRLATWVLDAWEREQHVTTAGPCPSWSPQRLEALPVPKFQSVKQHAEVNRGMHVWFKRKDGSWKCALCGGVTRRPTDDDLPDTFEPLTDYERALCRPAPYPRRQEGDG